MVTQNALDEITDFVEESVDWEGGSGTEWECSCLIDAPSLAELCKLAAHAPLAVRRKFLTGEEL